MNPAYRSTEVPLGAAAVEPNNVPGDGFGVGSPMHIITTRHDSAMRTSTGCPTIRASSTRTCFPASFTAPSALSNAKSAVDDVALSGSCRALRSRHRMYKPQRDVALNRLRHSHLAALIDAREPSIPTTTPRAPLYAFRVFTVRDSLRKLE